MATQIEQEQLLRRLRKPEGIVDVVLDTDAFNEIDDQFAIAYLLQSGHKLRTKALYAAPFFNDKSTDPADGMEKSYDEILRLLKIMNREELLPVTLRGSTGYLPSETEAVDSPAARHLAALAMSYTPDTPLYVVAIGAITNVASAILMNPAIVDRIVVVWLGGHATHWHDTHEFNMQQDVAAARVVFGCGAAVVQLPCAGVVSAFTISGVELKHWLLGKNALCDYLVENTTREIGDDEASFIWTRIIWDVTAIGWLLNEDTMLDSLEQCPIPEYDHLYAFDRRRHFYRYVYHINRDNLFVSLVNALAKA